MENDVQKLYEKAVAFMDQGKFAEMAEYLLTIADEDTNAQFMLGMAYLDESNPEHDPEKGADFLQKAVDNGNMLAQYVVQSLGLHGDIDTSEYEKFSIKVGMAQAGDAEAQYYIGDCYYDSEVLPWDLDRAAEWFQKSAENGYAPAMFALGSCYENGEGVDEDVDKAYEWFERGAALGNADCECALGCCYYYGDGVEKSDEEAIKWFETAANKGHAHGMCMLAGCYMYGHGVKIDADKAIELYREAAEKGDEEAKLMLEQLTQIDD